MRALEPRKHPARFLVVWIQLEDLIQALDGVLGFLSYLGKKQPGLQMIGLLLDHPAQDRPGGVAIFLLGGQLGALELSLDVHPFEYTEN